MESTADKSPDDFLNSTNSSNAINSEIEFTAFESWLCCAGTMDANIRVRQINILFIFTTKTLRILS